MTLQSPDHRLAHVPWCAVAAEFTTALCFGCLGLFVPFVDWIRWPELLFGWHYALIVIGAVAVALALVRRRPQALKEAIVLAAYMGLPSLLSLSLAINAVRSAADAITFCYYVVWGVGMLGQIVVVWSCLSRLAPA